MLILTRAAILILSHLLRWLEVPNQPVEPSWRGVAQVVDYLKQCSGAVLACGGIPEGTSRSQVERILGKPDAIVKALRRSLAGYDEYCILVVYTPEWPGLVGILNAGVGGKVILVRHLGPVLRHPGCFTPVAPSRPPR